MDKKEVKTLVLAHFRTILKEKGFKKIKDTLFVKNSDENVLQIVNFDFGSIGFTCTVALQPLYIIEHTKGINLTMGGRLSRFNHLQQEWWSYDHPTVGIYEIESLLLRNGMPWLEKYSTPESISMFILNNEFAELGLVAFRSFHQKKNLGFSLLYSGRIEEGRKVIFDLMSEISDNAVDFMMLYKSELNKFIHILDEQPEAIPQILADVIEDNKRSLKL